MFDVKKTLNSGLFNVSTSMLVKITVYLDMTTCLLVICDVLEELATSIFRPVDYPENED
jgi:hypothetical protein